MKIGVFDSGIGGITVLEALLEAIPEAEYLYLGDTANVPYGTKSEAQVIKLSLDCVRTLAARDVNAIVVACNTASSLALAEMRAAFPGLPIYGVVEPGAEAAVREASSNGPVLVLATRATVRSGAYGRALRARLDPARHPVFEQACPLLVPMIEEGWIDHPVLHQTLSEYLREYRSGLPGVALLGCTHYPWIQAAVEKKLPGWKVVNSAQAVARTLKKELAEPLEKGRSKGIQWMFTDPDAVPSSARRVMEKFGEKFR